MDLRRRSHQFLCYGPTEVYLLQIGVGKVKAVHWALLEQPRRDTPNEKKRTAMANTLYIHLHCRRVHWRRQLHQRPLHKQLRGRLHSDDRCTNNHHTDDHRSEDSSQTSMTTAQATAMAVRAQVATTIAKTTKMQTTTTKA